MKGRVNTTILNVRSQPDLGADILGVLFRDQALDLTRQHGVWHEIEFGGQTAFVHGDYVQIVEIEPQASAGVSFAASGAVSFAVTGAVIGEPVTAAARQGRVTTAILNVRDQPTASAAKVGEVFENQRIDIVSQSGEWYEIQFGGQRAFVHGDFVRIVSDEPEFIAGKGPKQGRVLAALLNVRSLPDAGATQVGQLFKDRIVEILDKHDEWYEIRFNGQPAYVHADFVRIVADDQKPTPVAQPDPSEQPSVVPGDTTPADGPKRGRVTIEKLNVRDQPSTAGQKIGALVKDQIIEIIGRHGNWVEFVFQGRQAFAHRSYLDIEGELTPPQFLYQRKELQTLPLIPQAQLLVSGSARQQLAAKVWNKFGNLMQTLSQTIGIDVGCAIAVFCVESTGKGFNPDGRLIIRFENHIFWNYWGKHNAARFNTHFQYDQNKSWQGHVFRTSEHEGWKNVHSSQDSEWRALEFARSLDDKAALYSISMGLPQVMGFNHRRIGYDSVQAMFGNFQGDIRYQIIALFDFANDAMIQSLRQKDFVSFALGYNGSGQEQLYGGRIQSFYEAFQGIQR